MSETEVEPSYLMDGKIPVWVFQGLQYPIVGKAGDRMVKWQDGTMMKWEIVQGEERFPVLWLYTDVMAPGSTISEDAPG